MTLKTRAADTLRKPIPSLSVDLELQKGGPKGGCQSRRP